MSETIAEQERQQIEVDQPQVEIEQSKNDLEKFETDLEFDCPESIDFKDPNVEDDLSKQNQENVIENKSNQLVRNVTRTKLYKTTDKKMRSPVTKKKPFKPVTYNHRRPITNVNERLYNAAMRRQPTYKTLAELVQDFDKKTRVYEDENEKKLNNARKQILHPRSPKLLSKNRNRTRTALSQLEKDELIAFSIKKNTFKAQPINKKIFDCYPTGIPRVQCKKSAVKNHHIDLYSTKRFEMRKEKMKAIHNTIVEKNNFPIFKATPMPHFKKVPIMLRNNQLIKRQTSEMCLNKNTVNKLENTIVKQISDSTLIRIPKNDLMSDCSSVVSEKKEEQQLNDEIQEKNDLIMKSINGNLIETEDEDSICEFKSLTNFENNKVHDDKEHNELNEINLKDDDNKEN